MPLPLELQNPRVVNELIKRARAVAIKADGKKVKVGDRVYVLYGGHDHTIELLQEGQPYVVGKGLATIETNNNGSGNPLQVRFAETGETWWLNKGGSIVTEEAMSIIVKEYIGSIKPPKIESEHLDKLVLDDESKKEIMSVLKQHTNLNKIFKEWGLDEIMEYGKAMSLLFYGPPGTGKTWAATCIAKALGKEVLVISAAEIQTSEPGGANRNIQQAFTQAAQMGHVLFLDECDGLITDRSHVGMILASEINTLLTCLEKFEGVVIFATNRADTLDPAMARRISLMVEFKNPDEVTRVDIWKVLLPKKMPLDKDVSIEKLAKFELTGGYIKNAILSAARAAASEEATCVSMKHFARAIKRIRETKDIMGTHTSRKQDFVKARG